jgi:hypothetical protein
LAGLLVDLLVDLLAGLLAAWWGQEARPRWGQPRPSRGSLYGSTPQGGSLAGSTGSFTAGQIVPQNVPITNQYLGTGTAYINGQRVLVDTNTNRVLRPY